MFWRIFIASLALIIAMVWVGILLAGVLQRLHRGDGNGRT